MKSASQFQLEAALESCSRLHAADTMPESASARWECHPLPQKVSGHLINSCEMSLEYRVRIQKTSPFKLFLEIAALFQKAEK